MTWQSSSMKRGSDGDDAADSTSRLSLISLEEAEALGLVASPRQLITYIRAKQFTSGALATPDEFQEFKTDFSSDGTKQWVRWEKEGGWGGRAGGRARETSLNLRSKYWRSMCAVCEMLSCAVNRSAIHTNPAIPSVASHQPCTLKASLLDTDERVARKMLERSVVHQCVGSRGHLMVCTAAPSAITVL